MSRFTVHPIRAWKDKLLTTAIVLAVVVAMKLFSVPCPFWALTDLPCPTCGMTRAWMAVFLLDFPTAFSYHPLFWTVPLLYLCYLYDGRLFATKRANATMYIPLCMLFGICWVRTLLL